ncbi:MAG: AAA family ATPase [Myxococcota bacterium]|nr:AAA family ATPase [Myxococcota bacterium]
MQSEHLLAAVWILASLALTAWWGYRRGRASASAPALAPAPERSIYAVASEVQGFYQASAHPADLLDDPGFQEGVALLADEGVGGAERAAYFAGDNAIIACMAVEAMRARRDRDGVEDRILEAVGSVAPWSLYFGLRYLAEVVPTDRSIVGAVLAHTADQWDYRLSRRFLLDFVAARSQAGEGIVFGDELERLDAEHLGALRPLLEGLDPEPRAHLLEELERWRGSRIDRALLGSVGVVWDGPGDRGFISHPALDDQVAAVEAELVGSKRPVLLVGESGVGKTCIAQAVAARLQPQGWLIFEAGPTSLVAGQTYYGQFEQRMQELLAQLRGQRVLWLVPDFDRLAEAGTHRYSSASALDLLLPHLESGALTVLGECAPGPYERLVRARPRITTSVSVRRVEPLLAAATRGLARRWWEAHAEPAEREAVLTEAWELAQQYLADRAAPGNLMRLLEITRKRLVAAAPDRRPKIQVDDLIVTLSEITGLPPQILDERRGLDVAALGRRFSERVIGQPEAVECLVERVSMVKAGLTDPSRPFGVFLFAGPTGTGKTEIAKTLAEFLFGSPDRMIRIDMSELQRPEDLDRLLGSPEPHGTEALVDRIRQQPFSVLLLDEFEKAHARVWDLFLQLFDDGRLTDRRGQVADFRYCIVILTSNLGATMPSGERLGFSGGRDRFSSRDVLKAVGSAFRPELLNRLDRVVVFRPLDRETMRGILRKELEDVLQRRGLRARPWAVEWDPAGIEYLLEQGFSPTLGARPLQRAIERHLLAPLARTIVEREFPTGDQFLYVTVREGALDVQFIDPDAPDESEEAHSPAEAAAGDDDQPSLLAIAREARGTPEELALLETHHADLREVVAADVWQQRKQEVLEMTSLTDFWRSPDRFEMLGRYEYQGRIEAGVRRTGSLLGRLRRSRRERAPTGLLQSVAQTLMLLEVAREDVEQGRPQAAFVEVRGSLEGGLPDAGCDAFARRIGAMYRLWGEKRRMKVDVLEERAGDERDPFALVLSVSGFGAYSILAPEDGLHVLEVPADAGRGFDRHRASVHVVAHAGDPGDGSAGALRGPARAALGSLGSGELRIVRRYRSEPSPLVRDGVRGWRTGRLDRVLGGDFDLMAEG